MALITEYFVPIKLRTIDPAYYITQGKLEEIIEIVKKEEIEEVIFSDPLSSQQERNLSRVLHCRVFDRTDLILEIFEKGAQSAEGKTQVALAMLQHQKARLSGRGLYMSQQGGRIGTRGPGETQKEKETQHIEHLMVKLRRDLKKLQQIRDTQRKQRLSSALPLICLIGYTNAGKSTILNALTKSTVLQKINCLPHLIPLPVNFLLITKKLALFLTQLASFNSCRTISLKHLSLHCLN